MTEQKGKAGWRALVSSRMRRPRGTPSALEDGFERLVRRVRDRLRACEAFASR